MGAVARQRPCAVLKREHRVIIRVLDVLERLLATAEASDRYETEALDRCVEFFRSYADACHHAKEEDLLFPVLEQRGIPNEGGPIGVMLHEHEVGRSLVRKMAQALDRMRQGGDSVQTAVELQRAGNEYIALLRQHIAKEDNVLFMMGDSVMTDEDQDELADRFCDAGCKAFGGRKGEELEAMADELERVWGRQP